MLSTRIFRLLIQMLLFFCLFSVGHRWIWGLKKLVNVLPKCQMKQDACNQNVFLLKYDSSWITLVFGTYHIFRQATNVLTKAIRIQSPLCERYFILHSRSYLTGKMLHVIGILAKGSLRKRLNNNWIYIIFN